MTAMDYWLGMHSNVFAHHDYARMGDALYLNVAARGCVMLAEAFKTEADYDEVVRWQKEAARLYVMAADAVSESR